MGTAIGPVFTYLLAQLPAVVVAVDASGLVADGYPITYPPSGSPLVGVGAESPMLEATSGAGTRAYVELGAQNVEEDFTIPCYVAVSIGGNRQDIPRNTAIAVYDGICNLIASDLTLGGALHAGRWAEIGPVTVTQTPPPGDGTASTGRYCVIAFTVHCTQLLPTLLTATHASEAPMKFRNVTDDARTITSLGVTVEPGCQTPDLDKAQAAGFTQQKDVWAAVDPPKSKTTTESKE